MYQSKQALFLVLNTICFFLISLQLKAQTENHALLALREEYQQLTTFNFPKDEPTCLDLFNLIRKKEGTDEVSNLDKFLKHLKSLPEYKPYFDNYLFVYKSKSLQQVTTPIRPRAILFGNSARMVMTFLSGKDQGKRDALEVMCFNEKTGRFSFHEIDFNKKNLNKNIFENLDRYLRDENWHIPSDRVCLTCHTVGSPRPNFDPYNVWPGVFGSLARDLCSTIVVGTKEHKFYQEFLIKERYHGRYALLNKEFDDDSDLMPINCPRQANSPAEITVKNATSAAPAENFLDKLTILNRIRLIKKIKNIPNIEKFYPLLGSIHKSCPSVVNAQSLLTMFPEQMHNIVINTYVSLYKKINQTVERDHKERLAQFLQFNNHSPYDPRRSFVPFVNKINTELSKTVVFFLIFDLLKVNYTSWHMGFGRGQFDFTTGANTQSTELSDISVGVIPEEIFFMDCNELAQESVQSLSSLVYLFSNNLSHELTEAIRRAERYHLKLEDEQRIIRNFQFCQTCHNPNNTNSMIPAFNFGSPFQIKQTLRKNPGLLLKIEQRLFGQALPQMPLNDPVMPHTGKRLDFFERALMVKYLKNLQKR